MKLNKGLVSLSYQRDSVPNAGEYPFNLAALKNLGRLSFHPKVTYFSGENGMGKSTLVEAIAVCKKLMNKPPFHGQFLKTVEMLLEDEGSKSL